jgi:hypothetical protein
MVGMAGRQVLAQLGQADIILSGEPEITFFKENYAAQGLYASRVIDVSFETTPRYGTETFTSLPLNGDLMTAIFARFDLNVPQGLTDFLPQAGLLMIDFVELYSGTQLIERLWGEYISLLNGCQVPTSQQSGLVNITGPSTPGAVYIPSTRYTVPLPFTCLAKGMPVTKDLSIRIRLSPSASFTSPVVNSTLNMQFHLLVEYVVLSEREREWIRARGPVTYVCESVQRAEYTVPPSTANVRCVTSFLHPVKELFITVKNQVSAKGYDYWFDYSNSSSAGTTTLGFTAGFANVNQLNSMAMYFNEALRVDPIWGTYLYLGTTQFMDNHTRVPIRPYYMYSFSQDPEGPIPTGSVNFGRLKNQYFDFFLKPLPTWNLQPRNLTIWARHYTFLEVNGFETVRNLFDNRGDDGYILNLP